MTRKILVPWAMLERGKEVWEKSKAEVRYLHRPKGELPTLKELIDAVRQADVLGIPITNTPGVLTETTADLALALLIIPENAVF